MFSPLQQYILRKCYASRSVKLDRRIFGQFYLKNKKVKPELVTKIISKSIERLIDRGMLVGYGVRTPKKWYIKKVSMTLMGRKKWLEWLKRKQRKLPI